MTKVGRLFEEEKLEAVYETKQEIARNMLAENIDVLTIMKTTGLSKAEILKLLEN